MRRSSCSIVAALCVLPAHALAQTPTHPGLTYATLAGQPLQLDLYIPPAGTPSGAGPYPVLVWIHGGGWSSGNRFPIPALPTNALARGFAVASVSYRLTSQAAQWAPEPVIWPAQIHDVKGAVRWLRANAATYNLDPARITSAGSSAGGHLSAILATSGNAPTLEGAVGGNLAFSSAVIAAVDYFGPTDLLNMQLDVTTPPGSIINHDAPTSAESRLIGYDQPGQGVGVLRANQSNPAAPFPALLSLITSANPITHVDPADPPMFIAHGTSDTAVPINQSVRLRDALQGAAVPVTYLPVPGAGHGPLGATTDQQALAFLTARVGLPVPCYPNCDGSTTSPTLNAVDFSCFLQRYRQASTLPLNQQLTSYPNCDASTLVPILNALDFACFLNAYRTGCP